MVKRAILVEDDEQQAVFTTGVLRKAGFIVLAYKSAAEATAAIPGCSRPVDLVILDRRLPLEEGDEPVDEVGDELLDALLELLPDTPFVIFSGYTGVPHIQFATRERGVIPIGPASRTVDRVTPFDKEQSIEFASHVAAIATKINELDDVEADCSLDGDESEAVTRRLLKRVAIEMGASSLTARALAGGLTGAPVWLCQLRSAGVPVGTVVVKQSPEIAQLPGAGLHTLLPGSFVAARVAVVVGMCDGRQAQVMQLAGNDARSLLDLLELAPGDAASHLRRISDVIQDSVTRTLSSLTVAELCAPLGNWETLHQRLESHGVTVPRGSLVVTTNHSPQHGDLHPGNILVSDGHPILIDFDSEVVGSSLLDPLTALLSPLFHAESPFRDRAWPTTIQCSALGAEGFFTDSPCEGWMRGAWDWVQASKTTERELWSLVMAYSGRQLKYPDVLADDRVKSRAVALARLGSDRLAAS